MPTIQSSDGSSYRVDINKLSRGDQRKVLSLKFTGTGKDETLFALRAKYPGVFQLVPKGAAGLLPPPLSDLEDLPYSSLDADVYQYLENSLDQERITKKIKKREAIVERQIAKALMEQEKTVNDKATALKCEADKKSEEGGILSGALGVAGGLAGLGSTVKATRSARRATQGQKESAAIRKGQREHELLDIKIKGLTKKMNALGPKQRAGGPDDPMRNRADEVDLRMAEDDFDAAQARSVHLQRNREDVKLEVEQAHAGGLQHAQEDLTRLTQGRATMARNFHAARTQAQHALDRAHVNADHVQIGVKQRDLDTLTNVHSARLRAADNEIEVKQAQVQTQRTAIAKLDRVDADIAEHGTVFRQHKAIYRDKLEAKVDEMTEVRDSYARNVHPRMEELAAEAKEHELGADKWTKMSMVVSQMSSSLGQTAASADRLEAADMHRDSSLQSNQGQLLGGQVSLTTTAAEIAQGDSANYNSLMQSTREFYNRYLDTVAKQWAATSRV